MKQEFPPRQVICMPSKHGATSLRAVIVGSEALAAAGCPDMEPCVIVSMSFGAREGQREEQRCAKLSLPQARQFALQILQLAGAAGGESEAERPPEGIADRKEAAAEGGRGRAPFADALRAARRAAGLEVADLARRCGASAAAIYFYESASSRPSDPMLGRIVRALGRHGTALPAALDKDLKARPRRRGRPKRREETDRRAG